MKINTLKTFVFITIFSTLLYASIIWATPGHANVNTSTPLKASEKISYLDKVYSEKDLESRIVRLPGETTCFDSKIGVVFNPYDGKVEK